MILFPECTNMFIMLKSTKPKTVLGPKYLFIFHILFILLEVKEGFELSLQLRAEFGPGQAFLQLRDN